MSAQDTLDLKSVFPGYDVCLLRDEEALKTWRIRNIAPSYLNQLRNWLETGLEAVAISWINLEANDGILTDELVAHRLALIPIAFDPELLERSTQQAQDTINEKTAVLFEIAVTNKHTDKYLQVFSNEIVWKPFGEQGQTWKDSPPRVDDARILVTVLEPRGSLRVQAYATRGTKADHARHAAALSFFSSGKAEFSASPARAPAVVVETSVDDDPEAASSRGDAQCEPCGSENFCFHFTVELVGGLTFAQIGKQLAKFKFNPALQPAVRKISA